jgi:hypothetical protein
VRGNFFQLVVKSVWGQSFDNMKRLGFRDTYLSTDKNAEARTKRSQTTEPQLFYIVCYGDGFNMFLEVNPQTNIYPKTSKW